MNCAPVLVLRTQISLISEYWSEVVVIPAKKTPTDLKDLHQYIAPLILGPMNSCP